MESYIKMSDSLLKNNHICLNAKILYSRLQLLSYKDGYCFANNMYLSKELNVTTRTITRLLKELITEDLILIKYDFGRKRKIYIKETSIHT